MAGVLYVASERLRWGDGHIEVGALVPSDEAGRDYDGMLRLGQIAQVGADAVGDEAAQAAIEALTAERDALAARVAELEAGAGETPADGEVPGETAEEPESETDADADPEADAKSEPPEEEKTEPPAEGDGSDVAPPAALERAELLALLAERGVEIPKGPVTDDALAELLAASDAEADKAPASEPDPKAEGEPGGPAAYADLNGKALKAELTNRGLDFKAVGVRLDEYRAQLQADDAAKAA